MNAKPASVQGFTLVELMVVIVIMGIMASLILLNTRGTDQRKAMQAREVFLMDVQTIRREANDQSRILALNIQPGAEAATYRYSVQEYAPQEKAQAIFQQNSMWKNYPDFPQRALPEHVRFSIQPVERRYENASNTELLKESAPKLIWLGNGEVKPVRIQFYFEDQQLGNEIEIDHLGKINES